MKKSTPAPIFNHRKRPRQAVIADPQNIDGHGTSMSTNSHQPPNVYQDLMPVHGFGQEYKSSKPKQGYKSYQQQNKTQQNQRQQQQSQHYSYKTNGPSPGRQLPTFNKDHQGPNRGVTRRTEVSSRYGSAPSSSMVGQSGQGWQADQLVQQHSQRWGNGQAPYTNKQVANTGSMKASHHQAPQSHSYVGNNMSNSYGQQQNRYNNGDNNFYGQGGGQSMLRADNSRNTSSRTNMYMNQKPTFQTDTHRNQSFFRPGPSGAATVQRADNCREQFKPQEYQGVGSFGDSSSNLSTSFKLKEPQRAPQKSRKKADNNLHLITSTIQGIKHWSKYKDRINMIFEVYGVVDSALMKDPSATGKEFLVKDEQDSISCVFYEIDRQLPRLTRGHWHRCVGSLDGRSGKLKCVSVRPASVQEKDLSKVAVKKSDNFLCDLTKNTPEP